jgi:hypothetical protein
MHLSNTPFYWEPDPKSIDIDSHRTVSITRYSSTFQYDYDTIKLAFSKNFLKRNEEFGCIDVKDYDKNVHVVIAKLNKRGFKSPQFNEDDVFCSVDRFKIKVISATIHIDNFSDENSRLNLLVFNIGNIRKDRLFTTYRDLFEIPVLEQMKFDERVIRKLCFEKFSANLYEINIDSTNSPDFGAQTVDYKSDRDKIINPKAEKINEIKENKEIKITGFKSFLISKYDNLKEDYHVRFSIDNISGKIILEFPKLSWSDSETKTNSEIESDFYNYARKVYTEIINTSSESVLDRAQKDLTLWVHND